MATQESKVASHGRGGAGNIGKEDPLNTPRPEDLVTPTLKSENYTTGRGGTGNIVSNDNPENARLAQDVTGLPPSEPTGRQHYGRGGAANVIEKDGQQQRKSAEPARKSVEEKQGAEVTTKEKGFLAKGKEFLNKLGKK